MSNKSIIEKIQKLLNLAEGKGATEAEAATAAAQAQRLMDKHRIEQAELEAANNNVDEEAQYFAGDSSLYSSKSISNWRVSLAVGIAHPNDCKVVIRRGNRSFNQNAEIQIIGRKSDVAVVRYLFSFAEREIERLCKQAILSGIGSGKSFSNNFKHGAVESVSKMLKDAKNEEMARYKEEGKVSAMVLLNNRMDSVNEALQRILGNAKNYRASGHACDNNARNAGRKAGRSIQFHSGMTGSSKEKVKQLN